MRTIHSIIDFTKHNLFLREESPFTDVFNTGPIQADQMRRLEVRVVRDINRFFVETTAVN